LDPVARYVVAADGLFQICQNPTLQTAAQVVRTSGRWVLYPETPRDRQVAHPWGEPAFVEAVDLLRRFG
jgi:hypothetical protein